ncbi:MAG: SPFH domain-containing protein [Fimbriimonadales bacterium]
MIQLMMLIGLVLIAYAIYGQMSGSLGAGQATIVGGLGLALFLIGGILWLIRHWLLRPSANLAYVITGLGGRRVAIDGSRIYIPFLHEKVPVSLETMKLEVERKGPDALITRDNLRVDVKAEFYIKVQPDAESVLNAARSLGDKSVNAQSVSALVFEKLVSALRSVAATKDLVEIHAQRDAFASAVQQLVRSDLEQNGLTLESVTISRLDQTSQELLSDNNIFDAQGKRKITEITQAALVERNRIEQEARREITLKNVETQKEILELERQRAEAEAAQQAEIAKIQAERKREAETYRIEQERQIQEAQIQQDQAVRVAAVERDRLLLLKQQELQKTDIERAKAIELAEREKEIAVAEAERQRAEAEKAALEAQAERERANQQIITVQQLAAAEREAQAKLIAAKQQIEQERIKRQTEVEVQAFAEVKQAEAKKQAAQLEAEAILTRAEAEAKAREQVARGETALKMVDVNIAREQVEVERARVEVERQALEYRQTYSEAALKFEIEKLRIEAQRDVQVELARAIGEFMSRGNMNIFGDPETLARMTEQYAKGLGLGMAIDGALSGLSALGDGNGKLGEMAQQLMQIAQRMGAVRMQAQHDSARSAEPSTPDAAESKSEASEKP